MTTPRAYLNAAQFASMGKGREAFARTFAHLLNAQHLSNARSGGIVAPRDAMVVVELLHSALHATETSLRDVEPDETEPDFLVLSEFERDRISDSTLLEWALDPSVYAYFDLYEEPPICGDGWTSVGKLFVGVTERMVIARKLRIEKLLRRHGRRNRWAVNRIEATVGRATDIYLDSRDLRRDLP